METQSIMERENVEFVKEVVKVGFTVFPLIPNSKLPAVEWSDPRNLITTPEQVEKTFKYSDYNVGVACGKSFDEGLVVVDCDINDETGEVNTVKLVYNDNNKNPVVVKELSWDDPLLKTTFATKTKSGGLQFFYKLSKTQVDHTGTNMFGDGVDIRGRKGMAVFPPSAINGKMYDIYQNNDIQPFPEELEQVVKDYFVRGAHERESEADHRVNTFIDGLTQTDRQELSLSLLNTYLESESFSYDIWWRIQAALITEFGREEAYSIIRQWSPRWTNVDEQSFKHYKENVFTVATIVYYAKQFGYTPKRSAINVKEVYNAITNYRENIMDNTSNDNTKTEESQPLDLTKLVADLSQFDTTDLGNVEALCHLFEGKLMNVAGYGTVVYTGKYWDIMDMHDAYIQDFITNLLRVRQDSYTKELDAIDIKLSGELLNSEKAKLIKTRKYLTKAISSLQTDDTKFKAIKSVLKNHKPITRSKDTFVEETDTIYYLPVNNGVIDLRTGELLPHDQKFLFTSCLSIDYDPTKKSELWEKQLQETVGFYDDPEVREYFHTVAGYLITGDSSQEKMYALFGEERSGKGTYMTVVETLLGREMSTALDFDAIAKGKRSSQNFELSGLLGKRVATLTEPDSSTRLDAGLMKTLTGNDTIQAAKKTKDAISFKNRAKLILGSNFKLNIPVEDRAAWGRLIVLPFPNSFIGRETDVKQQLLNPEELQGILNWFVEGAMKYFATEQKRIKTPQKLLDLVNEWREEADPITRFLEDNNIEITNNESDVINSTSLYNKYKEWAINESETIWARKTFFTHLSSKGVLDTDKQVWNGKKNVRCTTGIKTSELF